MLVPLVVGSRLVWIGSGLVAGSWPLGCRIPFNFDDSNVAKSFLGTSVRLGGVVAVGVEGLRGSRVSEASWQVNLFRGVAGSPLSAIQFAFLLGVTC